MRILIIANGVAGGGAENFAWNEAEALRARGHDVRFLSVPPDGEHSKNVEFAVSPTGLADKGTVSRGGFYQKLRLLGKLFWNGEVYKVTRRAIFDFNPDVVHLHRIRIFSMSLLIALRGHKGKVFMTLHDHYLTCPSSTRTLGCGRPCHLDRCNPLVALKEKCVSNSRVLTIVSLVEFHLRAKVTRAHRRVDKFLLPSNFLLGWTMRSGIHESRLSYLANFSPRGTIPVEVAENFTGTSRPFIFLGRLSEEKGILVLLAAAKIVPDATVLIVGDGPMRNQIVSTIIRDNISNVRMVGPVYGEKLREIICGGRALIIPSTCFETAPLVIIEAYQAGIPVIGANRGGISEMVVHEETGYLFEAENPKALAEYMTRLLLVNGLAEILGANGNRWGRRFEEVEHTDSLLDLYLM